MKKLVSAAILSLALLTGSAFAFSGQDRDRDRDQDRDQHRHARVIRTPGGRVVIVHPRHHRRWHRWDHDRYRRIP